MDAAVATTTADPEPQLQHSGGEDGGKARRVNKACLNCRKRKSRCHLDADGQVPCLRCKKENLDCVLGSSNRGGRRVRRKTIDVDAHMRNGSFSTENNGPFDGVGGVGAIGPWSAPVPQQGHTRTANQTLQIPKDMLDGTRSSRSLSSENLQFANLQNPSDALGILAQVAETSTGEENNQGNFRPARTRPMRSHAERSVPTSSYHLVETGQISFDKIEKLVRRYQDLFHPYYPLAPQQAFEYDNLRGFAAHEPQLLTAVLVIATKDLIEEPALYEITSTYMKSLVSDLAAGSDGSIGAVEALLILAEWAPYTQRSQSGFIGRGEEDKESWMHVGVALRIGYFLGLEKFSFRSADESKDPLLARKRLVWTACYMSDRSISIRIGRAFWSRGPGPTTSLKREDYPALLPKTPNDEDYASIFQATLELTTLFSNVHDVLYSGSSFRSHLAGGYIKFIDDFRSAIYGWKSVWGTLTCSPNLKSVLLISYDYLRLYTNAFAFQATIRRALPAKDSSNSSAEQQAPSRIFYNNVAALGDVRFIYEGLDAAKAILSTANNFVDPEKSLRFMPLRLYLYLVYAGVFLYRARCVGVMSADEERGIRAMVQESVSRLQRSAVGPQHPGSRYSQLLKLLWQKAGGKDKSRLPQPQHPSTMNHGTPTAAINQAESLVESSPAVTEQMGDFAWTDLMAVGDFAVNGNSAVGSYSNEDAFWSGFLPMDASTGFDMGPFDNSSFAMSF